MNNNLSRILSATNHHKTSTKKQPFFITSFVIAILSTIPATAQAGWTDSLIDEVKSNVDNIKSKVNDLPGTVQGKLGIALDAQLVANVKESISEVTEVVKDLQENREAFGDGSAGTDCFNFKESLKSMFINFGDLSNALSTLGVPNPPPVFSGENVLIDNIPCRALLSASFAFENTPLLELSNKLVEMNSALQELLPLFILAPQNVNFRSQNFAIQTTTELVHADYCSEVVDRRDVITYSALTLKGLSLFIQLAAAKIDTEVFTGGGDINKLRPKANEVDAGIHGYAHITVKRQEGRHKIAQGLQVLAKILDGVVSSASTIKNQCINTHNQFVLYTQQKRLLQLLDGQEEVIRILLTPDGKRESDFCHGDSCTSQSWNRTN